VLAVQVGQEEYQEEILYLVLPLLLLLLVVAVEVDLIRKEMGLAEVQVGVVALVQLLAMVEPVIHHLYHQAKEVMAVMAEILVQIP
jgi:hypothetical protein